MLLYRLLQVVSAIGRMNGGIAPSGTRITQVDCGHMRRFPATGGTSSRDAQCGQAPPGIAR